MSHYEDANKMLELADAAAMRAARAMKANPDDAWAWLPGMAGALVSVLVAQVHATLGLADAMREQP